MSKKAKSSLRNIRRKPTIKPKAVNRRTKRKTTVGLPHCLIGELVGFQNGVPYVRVEGSPQIPAQSTVRLLTTQMGCQVMLFFEQGRPDKPVIAGVIVPPEALRKKQAVWLDGERVTVLAEKEIVFKVGKSTFALTEDGRVNLRAETITQRARGANRVQGGTVEIN